MAKSIKANQHAKLTASEWKAVGASLSGSVKKYQEVKVRGNVETLNLRSKSKPDR